MSCVNHASNVTDNFMKFSVQPFVILCIDAARDDVCGRVPS
jgi:hypothetical protein